MSKISVDRVNKQISKQSLIKGKQKIRRDLDDAKHREEKLLERRNHLLRQVQAIQNDKQLTVEQLPAQMDRLDLDQYSNDYILGPTKRQS